VTPRSSAGTRANILHAARQRFASDGFHRATIRAIAADADIDPSMVMRYYGSKAALFAAAVDVDLRLPDLTTIPRRRLGTTLVSHFLDRWERAADADALLLLLRSAATDESAAARLKEIFARQVAAAVRRIDPDPARADRRAGLVATQMLGLALCRAILRIPPVVEMPPDAIVEHVGATIQRYLTAP
jgi:AcrR family transcriptional regulator